MWAEIDCLAEALADAHDELLARDRAYVNTLTAIARVRELCTASDEAGNGGLRTWQITDALGGE